MDPIAWLLESDAAVRWQAMRDLTDASPTEIAAERARVSREGLGSEILACQASDGAWRHDGAPVWLTTLFTFLLLRSTAVDPADQRVQSAVARLEKNLRWSDYDGCWELRPAERGGNPYFEGEVEPCINGGVLALGAYFGRRSDRLARRLLGEQLEDGGWNCEAPKSVRSSFHTTICVLEGLLEYERAVGRRPDIAAARRRAEEYLLERNLFCRLSTGEVADPAFLQFAFPPRYRYDVLRALDYFRNANTHASGGPNQPPLDPRLNEALQIVERRRQPDGRWLLDDTHNEALAFTFIESVGEPSRWNTLRALRILRRSGQRTTAPPA